MSESEKHDKGKRHDLILASNVGLKKGIKWDNHM